MTIYKVKANEELFNEIKRLELRVQFLGGIVQNDMELHELQVQEVFTEVNNIKIRLDRWTEKIKEHINY